MIYGYAVVQRDGYWSLHLDRGRAMEHAVHNHGILKPLIALQDSIMNMLIKRSIPQPGTDGNPGCVFGDMLINDQHVAFTIERTFDGAPKIPPGTYKAVRGTHKLHDGVPIEAYEITGVDGHSGLLLHHANWARQLDGCVAPGLEHGLLGDQPAVLRSDDAIRAMDATLGGISEFEITFVDA